MTVKRRTIQLSDDVWGALKNLKAAYGSYNKGLRVLLFPQPVRDGLENGERMYSGKPLLPVRPMSELIASQLDAVGPKLSEGLGKVTTETYQRGIRPKGDKRR